MVSFIERVHCIQDSQLGLNREGPLYLFPAATYGTSVEANMLLIAAELCSHPPYLILLQSAIDEDAGLLCDGLSHGVGYAVVGLLTAEVVVLILQVSSGE